MSGNPVWHITSKGNHNMTKQATIETTRKAYAKTALAVKAYIVCLTELFAGIPDKVLASYSGDLKDIPSGSHHAAIKAECDALKEALIANGVDKKSTRMYWSRAFGPVLAARGINKKGKAKSAKVGKADKADKADKAGKADKAEAGYTREKVIAAVTQLSAWVRDNENPDFSVNDTLKGFELALVGLNKVIINK